MWKVKVKIRKSTCFCDYCLSPIPAGNKAWKIKRNNKNGNSRIRITITICKYCKNNYYE